MKDLFVDQLVNVSVFQGVARLEFARIESVDIETNQAKIAPSYRVCMTLGAFSDLADKVANAKAQMQHQSSTEKQESEH